MTTTTATAQISRTISLDDVRAALITGILAANGDVEARCSLIDARRSAATIREQWGFSPIPAPILSPPSANLKLDKSAVPAYGITLSHFSFRSRVSTGRRFNFCPNAGHCTKVCVLDNGSGRYDSVQRGRGWKSDLLLHDPVSFFILLGFELERASADRQILCRPNVNSDLQWEIIAPALVDGSLFANVTFYGYTKLTDYLSGDGWITPFYRVAYSQNERTPDPAAVDAFLARGGSVAVVTDRKPHTPAEQWHPVYRVIDADLTDEWIFQSSVIGDLSAKGRARKLIGKSGFVYSIPVPVAILVGARR